MKKAYQKVFEQLNPGNLDATQMVLYHLACDVDMLRERIVQTIAYTQRDLATTLRNFQSGSSYRVSPPHSSFADLPAMSAELCAKEEVFSSLYAARAGLEGRTEFFKQVQALYEADAAKRGEDLERERTRAAKEA